MTVYVVVKMHWDETDVLGVFATVEAAKQSQSVALGGAWGRDGDGLSYSPQYGHIITIHPFEVRDAC